MSPTASGLPSSWLVEHLDLLPRGGTVLDVACGRGRHTLFLARAGFRVHAVDRDPVAVDAVRTAAREEGLAVECEVLDLEREPPPDLGRARYDAVIVFNYLHRPLFPALRRALAPGGRLVYETFTTAQAARGRPTNPAFLLRPDELRDLVAPLSVLRSREGDFEGRFVASMVAALDIERLPIDDRVTVGSFSDLRIGRFNRVIQRFTDYQWPNHPNKSPNHPIARLNRPILLNPPITQQSPDHQSSIINAQ